MKIHLIGIGGTGMGALAGLLREAGHEVRGSDGPLYPPMSTLLASLDVPLYQGFAPANLDWLPERVVVGNICRKDHPEAVAAQERGLVLTSFPALLAELFLQERHVLVVAGTHGKTTTSTLAAHLLRSAGLQPGYLIGGIPRGFEHSFAVGQKPYFVVEGDEYDCAFFDKRPKFVHYCPSTVILTSLEHDHADIYPTLAAVQAAFAQLIALVPAGGRILVCAEAASALELCAKAPPGVAVETYSVSGTPAHWQGEVERLAHGYQRLRVARDHQPVLSVDLPLSGTYNAANALAVAAFALGRGIAPQQISEGLASFAGVHRRQEVRGVAAGVTVIDDFAHHPTAIRETLEGLRGVHGTGRLLAAFEPRSATSRRRVFQHDFAKAFTAADEVVIGPLYAPQGIAPAERLDPQLLVTELRAAGTEACHLEEVSAIVKHLVARCRPGDTVVVMSSGSFDGLIERLLAALAASSR